MKGYYKKKICAKKIGDFVIDFWGLLLMFFFAEHHANITTAEDEWVLANTNLVGYYRVNYDESNWLKLLNTLRNNHKVRNILPNTISVVNNRIDDGNEDKVFGFRCNHNIFLPFSRLFLSTTEPK